MDQPDEDSSTSSLDDASSFDPENSQELSCQKRSNNSSPTPNQSVIIETSREESSGQKLKRLGSEKEIKWNLET